MFHTHVRMLGCALAMLCIASALAFAQGDGAPAISTGVVATITALDAKTGLATLQTEAGEVFELPKEWYWKMGDKVLCDRRDEGPPPRLQQCQPWQVHEAGGAAARREPHISSK